MPRTTFRKLVLAILLFMVMLLTTGCSGPECAYIPTLPGCSQTSILGNTMSTQVTGTGQRLLR